MSDEVLSPEAVDAALRTAGSRWERQGDVLIKVRKAKDFSGALTFVNQVGRLAEAADHHPDIDIRWNEVTLRLTTHSAHGLTEKDLALAQEIDDLG
jgi:4a-hydroxytetrahydrobiopterin dehydratase